MAKKHRIVVFVEQGMVADMMTDSEDTIELVVLDRDVEGEETFEVAGLEYPKPVSVWTLGHKPEEVQQVFDVLPNFN